MAAGIPVEGELALVAALLALIGLSTETENTNEDIVRRAFAIGDEFARVQEQRQAAKP